jgi:hypothetical protein
MALSGTFSTMPLTDLLQWLSMAQQTGRLEIRNGPITKTLFVEKGRLIAAFSHDPNEMLGQFLLARGAITEDDLRRGLRAQDKSRITLGKILVTCKVLSEADLKTALTEQAQEIIYTLFEWEEATFEFHAGESPDRYTLPVSLKLEDEVLKGVQRLDETKRIREVLPNGQVVLIRTGKALPQKVMDHPLALRIMKRLEQARTIDEITLDVHASPFQVRRFLFECLRADFVTVTQHRGEPEEETPSPPPASRKTLEGLVRRARGLLGNGECEAVLALLHEVLKTDSAHAEARKLMALAEEEFREQTYRLFLSPDSIPELAQPLEKLSSENLRPEEYFLLSRIDGTWDLKSIIDIAPMREVEALRVIKRLLHRRMITLRPLEVAAEG